MVQVISALLTFVADIFGGLIEGVFSFLITLVSKPEPKGYSAEFSSIGTVTSIWNKGISLVGGLSCTTKDVAFKNVLIVGPSGSGKTSTVLIGSCYTLARGNSSMVILDVSGEIRALTSGYLAQKGYTIYTIDFTENSESFNPLAFCETITDVQKIAFLLIKNSGIESKSDPYWSASAEMMLSIFMEYLVFYAEPAYRTMANLVVLADMFAADPKKVDLLFIKARSEDLFTRYKAMNAVSEKTLQSTLATVRTALKIFSSPAVQKCTSSNTVNFSTFRKEKSILYICTSINDVNFYAPYSALLFEALFKEVLSRIPEKHELSIIALIDEMVSMRFQNLGMVFANCRKSGASCLGILQDERMLEMNYSTAESHAIKSNCYSKVYLPGQPLATCKQLEEILGKRTYVDDKGIERTRHLMSASEIRMCKEAIVLCGNEPPIKAKLKPYYKHWQLSKWAQIPPYEPPVREPIEVHILPFDEA